MAKDKAGGKDLREQDPTHSETDNESGSGNSWKYSSEISSNSKPVKSDDSHSDITWSASEFIIHDKSFTWYVVLSFATIIISAIIYLLTHDKISTGIIILAGITFGVYGARKPRLLNYKINDSGITIQTKIFGYDTFKSFEIVEDSVLPNVILMPLKRFMPSLSIYLDPASQEEVIKVLSEHLPQDVRQQDFIERFTQRIRF